MGKKIISRYSYFYKKSDSVFLAYSSKTNALIEISEPIFVAFNKEVKNKTYNVPNSVPQDVLNIFEREGFVVGENDDDDYVSECQFITQSIQHNKSNLSLVLVPTLDCNFNCPYCFENGKRASRMSDEMVDHLINFIKDYGEVQDFRLTWYGGEPLLSFPIIEKILNRITTELPIRIARHSLITNGYLINDKVIELFQKFPLDYLQITLDGSKERHDKLRALKSNNEPTYSRVCKNIGLVAKNLPNTQLHVRVNIDKNNVNDYFFVHDELKKKYKSNNVIVYPGIIRLENEEKTNIVEPAFGRWETAHLMFDLFSKGLMDGDVYPVQWSAKTCCATCANSFIIGPQGEIYKCWNDVSNESKVVGHIDRPEIENKKLYYRYHEGCAWYNDPECKKCFFLPICNGKCAWYNEMNLYHGGQFNLCQCMQKAPGLLDKCLDFYYENQISDK